MDMYQRAGRLKSPAAAANFFEGWYFRYQNREETLAFIPGRAESGAFIQVLSEERAWNFPLAGLESRNGVIRAGGCSFSRRGAEIDLPGIQGSLHYGRPAPLRRDIMGPFRFFPMECRHSVLSMRHTLHGSISVEGREISFDNGLGYTEKDSGRSFPKKYLWLQFNSFDAPCSIMLAIASVPFSALRFTGCICAILYEGREYRFATYSGVRILAAGPRYIRLAQGGMLFEADILNPGGGMELRAPVNGKMSGRIRESSQAAGRFRLWDRRKLCFDLRGRNVGYEFV